MPRPSALILLCLGLECFGIVPTSAAQTREASAAQEAPAREVPQENTAPLPLPASEIARKAEETSVFVGSLGLQSRRQPVTVRIQTRLPSERERLLDLAQMTDSQIENQVSSYELEDLEGNWVRQNTSLDTWQGQLSARIGELDRILAELESREQVWQLTRQQSRGPDFPTSLRETIDSALKLIQESLTEIRQRRRDLFDLQNALVELRLIGQDRLQRVTEALELRRGRLFEFSAPPLWQTWSEESVSEVLRQFGASRREDFEVLRTYFREEYRRFLLDAFLFLSVLSLIGWLRKRSKAQLDDEALKATRFILSRPVSSTVVAIIIFSSQIHFLAPSPVKTVIGWALFVALVRLLPGLVPRMLAPPLLVLFALRTLEGTIGVFPETSAIGRTVAMSGAAAAFASLLWLDKRVRLHSPLADRWNRMLRSVTRAAMVLLLLSAAANVLGGLELSRILWTGTLRSIGNGILAWAVFDVLLGIMVLLLRTDFFRRSSVISRHEGEILRGATKVLFLLLLFLWLTSALRSYSLYPSVVTGLTSVLTASLEIGQISVNLRDFLTFGIAVWLSFFLARIASLVLDEDILQHFDLPRGVPATISRLAYYAVLLIGFFLAMGAAGVELDRFALLAGAFGVGLGFGLQNVVSNFVSGLILLFERPIQPGDRVQVGELTGQVIRIGARASTIRTFDGAEVIVPNANLIADQVVNWTLSDQRRRLDIQVGVAYGTDPELVLRLLYEVASEHPEVLRNPEPRAWFLKFGESSLDFSLLVWISDFDKGFQVRSELTTAVNKAFKNGGIEIPFPQRDLHVRSVSEAAGSALDQLQERVRSVSKKAVE